MPEGFTATASTVNDGVVDFTWMAVAGATGYRVEYVTVGVVAWTQVTGTFTGTTGRFTGTPGSVYTFRVIALNATDNSESLPSAVVTATAPLLQPATPAPSVSHSINENGWVDITWAASTASGSIAYQYQIARDAAFTQDVGAILLTRSNSVNNVPGVLALRAWVTQYIRVRTLRTPVSYTHLTLPTILLV